MSTRLRIGVVGVGMMGSLHARTVANCKETLLAWVADSSLKAAGVVGARFGCPGIGAPDYETVDAVIIAVPTQAHFSFAIEAIESKTPLLVEKPLAMTLEQTIEVVNLARSTGIPLQCGLLERFNPAVRTALDLVRDPVHFRSIRHSPMTPRIATGVGSDLLIHDLDLALRCFGSMPQSVQSMANIPMTSSQPEEIVEALLRFPDRGVASLSASRTSQRKVRSISISEEDRLIEVDLLRQDITIYKHVLESPADDDIGYRQQTIIDIPVLRYHGEPLLSQLEHFCRVIRGEQNPAEEIDSVVPPHQVLDQVMTGVV